MPTLGSTTRPLYAYDSSTDTWVPLGVADHSHDNYAVIPSQSGNNGKALITDGTNLSWQSLNYKREQSVVVSSNINVSNGIRYFVNTSAARTLTMPSSASEGDEIQIFDVSGFASANNITMAPNGLKINGVVQDLEIDVAYAAVSMVYTGSDYGWKVS